jgi:signal transduction histidine kinase
VKRLTTPGLRRVQVRTTATAMAVVVVVIAIAGIGLVRLFEREQTRQVDDRLRQSIERTREFVDRARAEGESLDGGSAASNDYIQAISRDGEVLYSSTPLEGLPALLDPAELADADELRTVQAEGIGSLRTMATMFDVDTVVVFGSPLSEVDDAVESLTRSLLLGFPFVVLGLGAVVWLVVGRTLRPVDEALRREQRLIADASHDLRSPLAGVRALLETEPADPGELEQNRVDALATLARLETIAEDLLTLARSDRRNGASGDRRLVDLDEVVLRQVQLLDRGTDTTIDTSALSAGQVVGNESDLERLVENLLTNAVRHARSRVKVDLVEGDGEVDLAVGDDGPGIPAADRDRVFERFTRLDASRTAGNGGAGLGLSIVQAVTAAHGGTVTVGESPLGGAEFRIVLPASLAGVTSRS